MTMWPQRVIVGVVGLMVGVILPGAADACEPIGEPKPWYTDGLAQFVARAAGDSAGAAVRATIMVGRNGAEALPPGPVVLVLWSFGPDCKPVAWSEARDGVWVAPATEALYTGRLRARDQWIDGTPTVDVEMARLQPVWRGADAGGLTAREFYDFHLVLPTDVEFNARQPQALARVEAWLAAHPEMAQREPVRSVVRWLRDVWPRRYRP